MYYRVVYNSVMEIANDEGRLLDDVGLVRMARREDARSIVTLLRNAPHMHVHADWHHPIDWLGSPGFVVVEEAMNKAAVRSMTERIFDRGPRINACLAAIADPPPAAWVRVAAVGETVNAQKGLSAMFQMVHEYMRQSSVSQLGWLLVESWPKSWIRSLGFEQTNSVSTFIKQGADIPELETIPGLQFRPVKATDLEELVRIDTDAFLPLWRYSEVGLTHARRQAFSFDVAVFNGKIVGYQCSTMLRERAHLSRIAVAPAVHGSGIGSALLAHAFDEYRRRGVEMVSLNTQLDNISSQRLYKRFGFKLDGQEYPVWTIQY